MGCNHVCSTIGFAKVSSASIPLNHALPSCRAIDRIVSVVIRHVHGASLNLTKGRLFPLPRRISIDSSINTKRFSTVRPYVFSSTTDRSNGIRVSVIVELWYATVHLCSNVSLWSIWFRRLIEADVCRNSEPYVFLGVLSSRRVFVLFRASRRR